MMNWIQTNIDLYSLSKLFCWVIMVYCLLHFGRKNENIKKCCAIMKRFIRFSRYRNQKRWPPKKKKVDVDNG